MNSFEKKTVTFETAERLLSKYGDVPWLALHQATILNLDGPRFNQGLVEQFEDWLKERNAPTESIGS